MLSYFCSSLFSSLVFISTVSCSASDTPDIMTHKLSKTMKAVGFYKYLPITDVSSLLDLEVNIPKIDKNEVLVQVKAISVNPIDTKVRALKSNVETIPKILGFDGSGIVADKGENVKLVNIGDQVFFTGDLRKHGANAQYVALDEVLVSSKPKNLSFEEAAAVPLTAVTAYESLFDRLLLTEKDKGKSLLVINSAGGVGSIVTQLAKNLGLTVIGTASRPESKAFTIQHGTDIVLNHTQDLISQLEANGFKDGVHYILVNYDPYPYWDTIMKAIRPQGRICLIVDSSGLVDIKPMKDKSVTLVAEMMNTRIKYDTEDKSRHNEILQEVSKMLDDGRLKTTLTTVLTPINAENLRKAHQLIENKHVLGKIVLSGF